MSTPPLNRTEAFVFNVCQQSFLSVWCYNNPRASSGKELCDILVVCGLHVIIISVKDILLNLEKGEAVAHARWERRAVDASVSQIYGAERSLASLPHVIRSDGTPGLILPPLPERIVHRIAVVFGDDDQVTIKSGDYGKGFVHVMVEESFRAVLSELDTITDLTEYLTAKEGVARSGSLIVCEGHESNMVAWYLTHDHTFPSGKTLVTFDASNWNGLQSDPAFRRKKEADQVSYAWDRLIEGLADPGAKPIEGPGPELNDLELALREMARESRLNRRLLGAEACNFVLAAREGKLRSRLLKSPSGLTYVFAYFPPNESPEKRRNELVGRCYVARQRLGRGDVLVGVGLSPHVPGVGSASDLIYVKFPRWDKEQEQRAKEIQEAYGYFANMPARHLHEDEFPKPAAPNSP